MSRYLYLEPTTTLPLTLETRLVLGPFYHLRLSGKRTYGFPTSGVSSL